MHAFDSRRVCPDLEHRLGQWHVRNRPCVDLECKGLPGTPILGEVVGAKGRSNHREKGPEDTVVVEAEHLLERLLDLCDDRRRRSRPRILVIRELLWVELRFEELNEQPDDSGIASHDPLDVLLAERGSNLTEVAGVRPNERGLAPGKPRADDEGVERIGLALAEPGCPKGLRRAAWQGCPLLDVAGRQPQAEVQDPRRCAGRAIDDVRVLVEDLDPHHLKRRQDTGQRHRRPDPDDLEAHAIRIVAVLRVPVECKLSRIESLDGERVGDCHRGAELLLVALWEGRRIFGEERRCLCLPQ